jgi:hypothetical protein
MTRIWKKQLGKLRRDRKGATAAEFALIAPLFFFMLLGAVEYGLVFLSFSAMQFGATIATRDVAVNFLDEGGADAQVRDYLPPWMRDDATVNVSQTTPGLPETNIIQMSVQVAAAQATPLPLFTQAIPWTLRADVSMKQELPYVD